MEANRGQASIDVGQGQFAKIGNREQPLAGTLQQVLQREDADALQIVGRTFRQRQGVVHGLFQQIVTRGLGRRYGLLSTIHTSSLKTQHGATPSLAATGTCAGPAQSNKLRAESQQAAG